MKISDIERPILYVLVGLPGSGKSTWCKKNARGFNILSTDNHIENAAKAAGKTYTEVFNDNIESATAKVLGELDDSIAERKNIVWDQTSLVPNKRKWVCGAVPDDYVKIAVVFEVNDNELQDRLTARASATGKAIPSEVIADMRSKYEPPSISEGFDKIIFK